MEIEITKERLASLFVDTAFKDASIIHVIEKTTGFVYTPLEAHALAHRAIANVNIWCLLANEDTITLSISLTNLLKPTANIMA